MFIETTFVIGFLTPYSHTKSAIFFMVTYSPDNWLGFLLIWSLRPTFIKASGAFIFLSFFETPLNVKASSTLDNINWRVIRL